MEITITPEIALLTFIIFFSGILALYFLVGKQGGDFSDKLLGIYFSCFSINFVFYLLAYIGILNFHWAIRYFLSFLGYVFLYLFVQYKGFSGLDFKRQLRPHLKVSMVLIVIFAVLNLLLDTTSSTFRSAVILVDLLVFIIYTIFTFILIFKYKRLINENYSTLLFHNINWASFVLIARVVYAFFPIAWTLVANFTNITFETQNMRLLAGSTTILYLSVVLWKVMSGADKTKPILEEERVSKYANSKLEENEKQNYHQLLNELMESKKPYLDSNLKLAHVAEEINVSAKSLSQIINEMEGRNFYDFVNDYRLEFAKDMLLSEDQKMTIAEIMYASGFNSKSSFNTYFKKKTGLSPSSFRKSAVMA